MPPKSAAQPTPEPDPNYDPFAIFDPANTPLHPGFMNEAVRTLMRALPVDPAEPTPWANRRMHAAMLSLAALHPRDEIETLLAVQALAAYHAAAAGWRIGMNHHLPNGDSTRHVSAAGSAARTFDALLKALERRQVKPLVIPQGRPAPKTWSHDHPNTLPDTWATRCQQGAEPPALPSHIVWTQADLAVAEELRTQDRIAAENAGLDLAGIEGILPGGGMVMPVDPTPQQEAYIARRLGLAYKREYEENKRKGIDVLPKVRTIRPGDLIP